MMRAATGVGNDATVSARTPAKCGASKIACEINRKIAR